MTHRTRWVLPSMGLCLCIALFAGTALAKVSVSGLFGDNMVLQQGMEVPIWGTAEAGEKITVRFCGQSVSGTTGRDASWQVELKAQASALQLPKTAMAVTIDIGDAQDIHPKNKLEVGKRLALAARAMAYGEKIVYSGPIYKSMKVEDGRVRLSFEHLGGGLAAKDGEKLNGFAIAGADGKFVWADAKIEDNTVVVWSDKVERPVAVRYAWANNPICNLYNQAGLPASPFRTDDW